MMDLTFYRAWVSMWIHHAVDCPFGMVLSPRAYEERAKLLKVLKKS